MAQVAHLKQWPTHGAGCVGILRLYFLLLFSTHLREYYYIHGAYNRSFLSRSVCAVKLYIIQNIAILMYGTITAERL